MPTLVIVAGQSNALTFGTRADELPADAVPDPHAMLWNWKAQAFEVLAPGVNTNAAFPIYQGSFGPEVSFARDYLSAHPGETVYFLKDKAIQGITPLAQDPNGWDWSPESRGEQYDKATAQVKAAVAALGPDTNVVVLWMQGETDSLNPEWDAAYGRNLDDFIQHVRSDWGVDTFLLARIADEWGPNSNVRAVETAHGAFSTDAYPMQADHAHFTGAGALLLGHDFFAAYEAETAPHFPTAEEIIGHLDFRGLMSMSDSFGWAAL